MDILHQYFLNKGTDNFFAMDQAQTEKQLAGYNVSNFLKITPSAETYQKMQNHRLVFKVVNTGFLVWSQVSDNKETVPLISLNSSLKLTFLLKLVNHTFINFTKLDTTVPGELFFFSNKRPDTEVPGFPLIKRSAENTAVSNDYVLSPDGYKSVSDALTSQEKQQVFGVIRICIKGENSSLDITNAQNEIINPAPKFQLVFENRKTIWRYFFNHDQKVKNKDDVIEENGSARQLVTKNEQPLTETGFVSIELDGGELPNPDASVIKPNTADNKIYSEIYM